MVYDQTNLVTNVTVLYYPFVTYIQIGHETRMSHSYIQSMFLDLWVDLTEQICNTPKILGPSRRTQKIQVPLRSGETLSWNVPWIGLNMQGV
jgi:hypothetical protein